MGIVVRQSFLNLISIGIAFLIGAVNTLYLYPTFLGSKLQGLIIALLAISNLLQPFISFGTQHAVIRYYSKYNKKTDKDGLLTLSIIIPLIIVIFFVLSILKVFVNAGLSIISFAFSFSTSFLLKAFENGIRNTT